MFNDNGLGAAVREEGRKVIRGLGDGIAWRELYRVVDILTTRLINFKADADGVDPLFVAETRKLNPEDPGITTLVAVEDDFPVSGVVIGEGPCKGGDEVRIVGGPSFRWGQGRSTQRARNGEHALKFSGDVVLAEVGTGIRRLIPRFRNVIRGLDKQTKVAGGPNVEAGLIADGRPVFGVRDDAVHVELDEAGDADRREALED